MIKKAKDTMKIAIILLLGILTFNIVYDVGVSRSAQFQEETQARDITSLDKVKAIAEKEVTGSSTPRPTVEQESKKSKIIKYVSIVGILILAIVMLIVLSNKEDLDE
ncbi:MAG: hypothetical protein II625_02590 [Bacilli bacterium]|nr:hypothetical protein [Bacilli bacterium]